MSASGANVKNLKWSAFLTEDHVIASKPELFKTTTEFLKAFQYDLSTEKPATASVQHYISNADKKRTITVTIGATADKKRIMQCQVEYGVVEANDEKKIKATELALRSMFENYGIALAKKKYLQSQKPGEK